jgi:hypothetical protein
VQMVSPVPWSRTTTVAPAQSGQYPRSSAAAELYMATVCSLLQRAVGGPEGYQWNHGTVGSYLNRLNSESHVGVTWHDSKPDPR